MASLPAVVKSAFDEVITDDIREKFGDNHYTLAVRLCIGLVNQWRNKYDYRQPIQYVFDRLSEGKGDIELRAYHRDAERVALSVYPARSRLNWSQTLNWSQLKREQHEDVELW